MSTTTLSPNRDVYTLVNVFTVAPERQQELVDLLILATEETMQHIDGFVSANIHRSHDGSRVVNYAQWRSREHFENMLGNQEALPHMKAAAEIAEGYEPILTELLSTHSRTEAAQ